MTDFNHWIGNRNMKTITLYRDDFAGSSFANIFDGILEDLGVETHTTVAGRSISNEIDEVTIRVSSVSPE